MEKKIRISTQGRMTIPKKIRETLNISDGQPVIVKSVSGSKQIIIEMLPTMSDFK